MKVGKSFSKAGKVMGETGSRQRLTSWMQLEQVDQVNVGKERPLLFSH